MIDVIGLIMPFEMTQLFNIYENGNLLDTFLVRGIENLPREVLYSLNEYKDRNINITLKGPKAFTKKLGEGIKEQELFQYKTSKIQMKYI